MDVFDLSQWIGPGVLLITLALAGILAAKGPTRALKIGVVVLLLGFVGWMGVKNGWTAAFTVLSVTLGVTLLSMGAAVRLHRMPLKKELRPVDEQSCPRHALAKLRDWTRGLEGLGFRVDDDRLAHWSFGETKRKVFVRFLRHHSNESWAEIHVLDEPKIAARLMASRKDGGLHLMTCDQQANEEFFRDARTRVNRVSSRTSCADLHRSHEEFVLRTPGALVRTEDPVSLHIDAHNQWITRLLDSGQLVVRGDAAVIPLRLTVPTMFRVLAAWFH
ncbi:MAG: hypothetical protein ACRD1X_05190 [Vicinamibacteria bacterium]